MRHLRFILFILTISFQLHAADLPQPDLTLMIPMRDGTELPTDIYLPHSDAKNCPCILIRSPSGRNLYKEAYIPLTQAGYAVAIQDTRSFLDQSGKTFPFVHDGWGVQQDGYDTVEWLAKHPLTNGKVGTYGFSAMGITQLLMAPTAPPSLRCQYIAWAASNLYDHGIHCGGQLYKSQIDGWLGMYAKDSSVVQFVYNNNVYNDFWQSLDSLPVSHTVTVPAIHYGGWYDTFSQGTIDAFVAREQNGAQGARNRQILIMGPWAHPYTKTVMQFPENSANPPLDISPVAFFNHYLKNEAAVPYPLPKVIYYVMGTLDGTPSSGNVWKTADRWPVVADTIPFYIHPQGKLSTEPQVGMHRITFHYNPNDPTPTIGGRNLFIESGPADQRAIEERDDVITFTSEPLTQDTEVTGRIFATLFLTSDRDSTDVAIRLSDVYPDGKSVLIADSIATLRDLSPANPKEAKLDLWTTAQVFAKGHKIRISISGSNYPRFDKNRNVGFHYIGPAPIAHNALISSKEYPSRIDLPTVR